MSVTSLSRPWQPSPPDGAAVELRTLERDDHASVQEIFAGLGARSRELRFLTPKPRLTSADLRQLTAVDHHDHVAILAMTACDGRPIGVARFVRDRLHPDTADVAVAVVDALAGPRRRHAAGLRAHRARPGGRDPSLHPGHEPGQRGRRQAAAPDPGRHPPRRHRPGERGVRGHPRRRRSATMTTLLGIWAHPDDEAYCSSGLMAQVRDDGSRVVVVTATRGEHGTGDPDAWPPERLAALRERELRESLAQAGVTEHRWLGHRDGELDRVAVEAGAATLLSIIEEVRPTVIVTFGPEGMTGHADHRAISAWTTHAWHAERRTRSPLVCHLDPRVPPGLGRPQRRGRPVDGRVGAADPRRLAAGRRGAAVRPAAGPQAPGAAGPCLPDPGPRGAGRGGPLPRWWSTESFVAAVRRRPATSTGDGPSAVRAG